MTKASWADMVEADQDGILTPSERVDGDTKIKIDYKEIEGKKYKVTRTYKIEHSQVSKTVSRRKNLAKFGDSKNDPAGPHPATTAVGEEIFMQFITLKDGVEAERKDDEALMKEAKEQIRAGGKIQCHICKEDHWSAQCPNRSRMGERLQDEGSKAAAAAANALSKGIDLDKSGKYVPPGLRDGARRGDGFGRDGRGNKEEFTVRVTNLSEDTRDSDMEELFKPFGPVTRIYLAKDKVTNQSKGFAFISYFRKESALSAIQQLDGYGYANLILNVEMANRDNQ